MNIKFRKPSIFAGLYLFFTSILAFGQNDPARQFAEKIKQEDLRDYLTILASDALEGRETGTRGQKMAAALIRQTFMDNGLKAIVPGCDKPGYLQHFTLLKINPAEAWIKINGKQYQHMESVIYHGNVDRDKLKTLPVVFVGPGSTAILKQIDIRGKAVAGIVKNSFTGQQAFVKRSIDAGAELAIIIYNNPKTDFQNYMRQSALYYGGTRLVLPSSSYTQNNEYFIMPDNLAADMFHAKTKDLIKANENMQKNPEYAAKWKKSATITFFTKQNYDSLTAENVLGYIEGSDKKNEYIFVTAHYDHLGRRGKVINNGADDDGSGTAAVMELAKVFSEAKKAGYGPRRSMIFMTVSGEEEGLLGSEYYTENPVVPIENTIVDLNIDMVGRIDPAHAGDSSYVYLIGADKLSSELNQISESTNEKYTHLELDYTYNKESDPNHFYYRSDHYNFAKHGIPIIFYFNGTHADYHRPTDTIDKIDFPMLQKRAQLVFYTAWELANRETRPVIDKTARTLHE